MMSAQTEIKIYEAGGLPAVGEARLRVVSHPTQRGRIILELPNAQPITVDAEELSRAVANSINVI